MTLGHTTVNPPFPSSLSELLPSAAPRRVYIVCDMRTWGHWGRAFPNNGPTADWGPALTQSSSYYTMRRSH